MARQRNEAQTVLSEGSKPYLVAKQQERRVIEEHIGRFIATWGFLDWTLSMTLASLVNVRLQANFESMSTATKIDLLRSLLPTSWTDGNQLLNLLSTGNKYRNGLAHPMLAEGGMHGGREWGWHIWKPNRESATLDLEDPQEMNVKEQDAKITSIAVACLAQDPFRELAKAAAKVPELHLRDAVLSAPNQWNTHADYEAFCERVEKLFGA